MKTSEITRRAPVILRALTLALVCGSAAFGCQIVAGLTVLQITGGTGGQGGGGGGGGCPCANGAPCDDDKQCESGYCATSPGGDGGSPGVCAATKALGNSCSSADECGSDHCTDGVCCDVGACADSCWGCGISGDGTCTPKVNAPCGSTVDDACTDPDTCDSAGICQPHHAAASTPCGGTCVADLRVAPGTCNGFGQCSSPAMPCPQGFACNSDGKTCNTTCTGSSDCAASSLCVNPMMPTCVACGTSPPTSTCMVGSGCESCAGGNTCLTTCDKLNECISDRTIDAGKGPARYECGNQCNNITLTCSGPYPCEVVCGNGGCNKLVLNCDINGPCKLTCTGTGCASATVNCLDNACNVGCSGGSAVVDQVCNSSCGCTKSGCQ